MGRSLIYIVRSPCRATVSERRHFRFAFVLEFSRALGYHATPCTCRTVIESSISSNQLLFTVCDRSFIRPCRPATSVKYV
jgi:hypothetical protein